MSIRRARGNGLTADVTARLVRVKVTVTSTMPVPAGLVAVIWVSESIVAAYVAGAARVDQTASEPPGRVTAHQATERTARSD